jgi:cytochrome c biogenesis protein CcmG/thiol:disulfide interchange protein DsbE
MTEPIPDERPQRRREYSGPGSTLGLAALIVLVVAAAIWWFEFRDTPGGGSDTSTPGLGIVDLPDNLNPTGEDPAARAGHAAPNFKLAATENRTLSLVDYRGKYVLLNFWASWCPPCRNETPDLQSFYEHNAGTNFALLGVNQQERPEAARAFLDEFGVTYAVALDRSGEVSQAYGVGRGMPVSFLLNPDGVIEKVYFGALTDDDFAELKGRLQ